MAPLSTACHLTSAYTHVHTFTHRIWRCVGLIITEMGLFSDKVSYTIRIWAAVTEINLCRKSILRFKLAGERKCYFTIGIN